jgi:acetyltransferase
LVEALRDVRFALPPLDERLAAEMVSKLKVATLLAGVRSRPPADSRSLHRAIVALSALAVSLCDVIAEIDVNPVIVSPNGCLAVDALVKTRTA